MANLVFDFLHHYQTGERRASDPADAYQYDEGHVMEAVVPVEVTSCEIHYWVRGQEEAEAYTPESITQKEDGSYSIIGHIPNTYFETYGELRVYIVVTDGTASITTYEGRIHICERSKPDDYVDDDPDNEAVQIIAAARGYAETSEAWAVGQINGENVPSTADQYQNNASYYANQAASAASSAAAQASLAPAYDNTATYEVGDYCLYSGQLYECTTAITTAEAWDSTHWTAVTVGGELSTVKDGLAHIMSSAVPTTVRQAIKTLFETGGYADTGLTDEMAVISSWASMVTAIALNQSSISISGSSTSQLVATTTPAGGTVTWSSSDTSVATVSSNGLVTGVGNGTATITATSGDVSATCTATVSGFKSLVSISAVYTQSGIVYDTDSLDDLKTDLVVTGLYDDQSTETITAYTLSGTLEVGTSTIVVSYGGKTTTFNVAVTDYESPVMSATQGNITSGSTDADKVTVVLNKLTFAPSEIKTISVDDGYQFFAFRQNGVNDVSNAGTPHSSNNMNVYSIGNNGYVQNGDEANNRISISNTNTWGTSKTYTNTNSSITQEVTGIGIYIKTTDGSALTPEQAVNVFSIS